MTEPTTETNDSIGHDHDTHDGEPCLHCMLTKTYADWADTFEGAVPANAAGYGLGQFMAETINSVTSSASHEVVTEYLANFHAAQADAAEAEADPNTKH